MLPLKEIMLQCHVTLLSFFLSFGIQLPLFMSLYHDDINGK